MDRVEYKLPVFGPEPSLRLLKLYRDFYVRPDDEGVRKPVKFVRKSLSPQLALDNLTAALGVQLRSSEDK